MDFSANWISSSVMAVLDVLAIPHTTLWSASDHSKTNIAPFVTEYLLRKNDSAKNALEVEGSG